jgi:predicted nucleotide-binding protein
MSTIGGRMHSDERLGPTGGGQVGEFPLLAAVPDAIADDLAAAGLATVVRGLRGPVHDTALVIGTSAALGAMSVVALARIPGIGPAVAEVLVRRAREREQTLRLRAETPDGTIEVDVPWDQQGLDVIRQVGDIIDRLYRPESTRGASAASAVDKKVFVIHGRDGEVLERMLAFLRALGLEPQEWEVLVQSTGNPLPSLSDVVARGLAPGMAQAVVALLTPDDVVTLHAHLHDRDEHWFETQRQMQPRPNVLIELGTALATHREQTIVAAFGPPLRRISDLDGLDVIHFTGQQVEVSITKLVQRLRLAGCAVDDRGTEWCKTGRFTGLRCYDRRPEP